MKHKSLFAVLALAGTASFAYVRMPWGVSIPKGESADGFWCESGRTNGAIRVTMDLSRKKDRDSCILSVQGENKAFDGTNKTFRLICRQSASKPLGVKAPEIRLMDRNLETFRFSGSNVSVVGDMLIASYVFTEENKTGISWGPEANGKFDGPVKLYSIHLPCENSGEVHIEGLEPESGEGFVECRESALSIRDGFDRFATPWNATGNATVSNGIVCASWKKGPFYISHNAFPGPAPFRGPVSVALKSKGPFKGTVTLKLKHRDSKKTVEKKAEWKENTVFEFDLPSSEFYQFEHIGFMPGFFNSPLDVEVHSLDATTSESPAAACRLDVDTGNSLHILRDPNATPHAVLANASNRELDFNGRIVAANFFGETIEIPFSATAKSGEVVRIPVDISKAERPYGVWRLSAKVGSDGFTAYPETRFAVLNKNEITPRLPKDSFRMGINYHFARYPEGHRKLTLDALNACGAKLVRAGGFSAGHCWTDPGAEPDFTSASKLMNLLKERGLSLNAGIWPNPKWMAHEKFHGKYSLWIRSRAKSGLMGLYAEKLARRFGEDIDYLETSNEADIWPMESMTAEEYIDYQKEAYEGIKRGCKGIRVLPSAFAAADSSSPQVVRKGFQETVLEKAKGFYDVHPVHMHSASSLFEADLTSKFFPMRKRLGVDVPWYANESALTSVNGAEDIVAKNVWTKILFAWAHGSTDYIWYNLKATGWSPSDPEQGYGLITASYHPRAGFAAFSALAHISTGLEFDSILCEKKGRHFYSFKGTRGEKKVFLLAGWDQFTSPAFPVRVKTDAKKAETVDIMGNSRPAEKTKDGYVFPIGKMPSAILLSDASNFQVHPGDVTNIPPPKVDARVVKANTEGRSADFVLDRVWKVRQLFAANPATVDRTWKGPEDLSAKIWIGRKGDSLRFRFEVTDDIHSQRSKAEKLYLNDGLQFILEAPGQSGNFEFGLARTRDGSPLTMTWIVPALFDAKKVNEALKLETSRTGTKTVYDASIPLEAIGFDEETLRNGFRFNAIVYDDDAMGESRDNWIEIVPGIASGKDYTDAPFVKIQD